MSHLEDFGKQAFAHDDGDVAGDDEGGVDAEFFEFVDAADALEFVDGGFVAAVHAEELEAAFVELVAGVLDGAVEVVEVVAGAHDEFLDGEGFVAFDAFAEFGEGACDEEAFASFGAVVFDDDGFVDVAGVFDFFGHGESGGAEPFAFFVAVGFPLEDLAVAEAGDGEGHEVFGAEVFDEAAMRDDDDVLGSQFVGVFHEVFVVVDGEEVVGFSEGEGVVVAFDFADGQAEGLEAFFARAVEDLEAGMRTDGGDGEVLGVVT